MTVIDVVTSLAPIQLRQVRSKVTFYPSLIYLFRTCISNGKISFPICLFSIQKSELGVLQLMTGQEMLKAVGYDGVSYNYSIVNILVSS